MKPINTLNEFSWNTMFIINVFEEKITDFFWNYYCINLHCAHLATITKESKSHDLKNSIYFKSMNSSFQAETVPFCWCCHLHFSSDKGNTLLPSTTCISLAFFIWSFIFLRQYLAIWPRLVLLVNFYLLWGTLLGSGYLQLQAKFF